MSKPKQPKTGTNILQGRIYEIDILRSLAIIAMCFFHLMFDLEVYYGFNINTSSGFIFYAGRASAIAFMLVSGISTSFATHQFRRVLQVFAAAMLVTLASIPTMGQNYIRFGILHFFASAMLIKAVWDRLVKKTSLKILLNIGLAAISFYLGTVVENIFVSTPLLLPFGIRPYGFTSFDYYPLFPWMGYFAIGIVLGFALYKNKKSLLPFLSSEEVDEKGRCKPAVFARPFVFLGRHSLIIYLVHQPLFLGILFLLARAGII